MKKTYTLNQAIKISGLKDKKKEIDAQANYYIVLMKIKEARIKAGISQAELASKANIPRSALSNIENGKRNVTISTLISIAEALGKRIDVNLV